MARAKQSLLEKRCKLLYASMKRRIEEKKDKNGRIFQKGQPVPFTYEQLLEWIIKRFNVDDINTITRIECRYCRVLIDYLNCAYDHAIPLKRSGSPGLGNLDAICRPCNDFKGKLTPNEFVYLLHVLNASFCEAARVDISSRLKKANSLAASVSWTRKKKNQQLK